jgi:ribonucleoside-diphosphate reductase alpha chain
MNRRGEVLSGRTTKVPSPLGPVFITLNENGNGRPFEIFVNIGKCGSDVAADAEAIGRLCSLVLHLPSPVSEMDRIQFMIQQLSGIGGSRQVDLGNDRIRSLADAVAHALQQYLNERVS